MIHRGSTLGEDRIIEADVVVVGTGAGGGMLLRDTARAGLRVVALEEGEDRTSASFDGQERHMLPLLYQDAAGRSTVDGAVQILQGRGVGGSTIHNTNLCKRTPDAILVEWAERFGLHGWAPENISADFRAVEELLHVSQIEPERVNANNDVLLRGMQKLGWRGGLLSHNRRGCAGSGQCELGCPFDAKENVRKVLVPDALAHGAEIWAELRAERVLIENGRAVGVIGRGLRGAAPGSRLTVRARAVVLAGSAVGSAALSLHSGLPGPRGLIGGGLHLHPGAAVAGIFDERIEGWSGIPQSVECVEHIDFGRDSEKRCWIVPAFAHPVGFAASLPSFGASHMRAMRRYPRTAILVAMLHDRSTGRVEARTDGSPKITYALDGADRAALRRGMLACAELLFAAGAREVLIPTTRPLVLTDAASARAAIDSIALRPLDPVLTAAHPMGTLSMAADPKRGVTDGEGRWHGLRGLYVADGSLFPTSIGGPPQISIYTAGRRVARALASDLSARR